jgi:restriction endonuclease S subunit
MDHYFHKHEFKMQEQKIRDGIYPLVTFDSLCHKITDGTHFTPLYMDFGIPFISVKDVREFQISFDDSKFISIEEHEILKKRCNPEKGDILLTKVGTIGLAAIIPDDAPTFDLFVSVCLLKLKNRTINPQFFCAVINSSISRIQFSRSLKGIGVPDLHLENIKETLIPLPPLEIQEELVAEIEVARESRKQKLAEADALLSSFDDYLLEQLGLSMPVQSDKLAFATYLGQVKNNRWDVKAYTVSGNTPFRSYYPNVAIHNFVSRIQERIDSNQIDREDFITLSLDGTIKPKRIMEWRELSEDESLFKSQMFIAREGQIIFSKIDFRNGAIAIVNQNKIAVTAEFPIYEIDNEQIDSYFFILILRSSLFLKWVNNLSSGHTGRKRVNPSQFESFEIPLPAIAIQEKIAQEVRTRREKARRLRSNAESQWEEAKQRFERKLLSDE